MTYEDKLAKELKNPGGYLWPPDSVPLSSLEGLVEDLLPQNQIPGTNIAAIFILHQLSEELIKIILKYCDLIVRASIFPIKYSSTPSFNDLKYSELIKLLTNTIEFQNKSHLIKKLKKLNDIRNLVGHNLIKEFYNISDDISHSKLKDLYDEIFKTMIKNLEWFSAEIQHLKKRKELQKILEKD